MHDFGLVTLAALLLLIVHRAVLVYVVAMIVNLFNSIKAFVFGAFNCRTIENKLSWRTTPH